MSDDEQHYVKRQKLVHYGSLAGSSDLRPSVSGPSNEKNSTPVTVTISGPNINTHNKYFEIQPDGMTVEKQNALEEFERKRKARQIAVSTDDIEVRAHLRNHNQPMCKYLINSLKGKL